MTDLAVGKLWQDLASCEGADLRGQLYKETMVALILYLIKERAKNKRLQRLMEDCGHYTYPEGQAPLDRSVNEEVLARRDFNIPDA